METADGSKPEPAAEYPPGTPVIINKYETYPAVVLTPPSVVGGNRVLAWSETRRRDGEYPGGVVLTVSNPHPRRRGEYVVWNVYSRNGGRTWSAECGGYSDDFTDAQREFTTRAQVRPATEF